MKATEEQIGGRSSVRSSTTLGTHDPGCELVLCPTFARICVLSVYRSLSDDNDDEDQHQHQRELDTVLGESGVDSPPAGLAAHLLRQVSTTARERRAAGSHTRCPLHFFTPGLDPESWNSAIFHGSRFSAASPTFDWFRLFSAATNRGIMKYISPQLYLHRLFTINSLLNSCFTTM